MTSPPSPLKYAIHLHEFAHQLEDFASKGVGFSHSPLVLTSSGVMVVPRTCYFCGSRCWGTGFCRPDPLAVLGILSEVERVERSPGWYLFHYPEGFVALDLTRYRTCYCIAFAVLLSVEHNLCLWFDGIGFVFWRGKHSPPTPGSLSSC